MAGYIGSKSSVTQVDGYNQAEADAEFVNDPNSVITVSGSNVGIGTSSAAYPLTVNGYIGVRGGNGITFLNPSNNYTSDIYNGAASGTSDLRFKTQATERMRIDSAGRVTMPYQPAWVAKFSVTKSQTTMSPILFDAVGVNIGSHYNGSTGLFTAPVAGRYQVNTHLLRSSGGSNYMNIMVAINGVRQDSIYGNAYTNQFTGEEGFGASWVVNLSANDTLALWLGSSTSPVNLYATETFMSGYLLG